MGFGNMFLPILLLYFTQFTKLQPMYENCERTYWFFPTICGIQCFYYDYFYGEGNGPYCDVTENQWNDYFGDSNDDSGYNELCKDGDCSRNDGDIEKNNNNNPSTTVQTNKPNTTIVATTETIATTLAPTTTILTTVAQPTTLPPPPPPVTTSTKPPCDESQPYSSHCGFLAWHPWPELSNNADTSLVPMPPVFLNNLTVVNLGNTPNKNDTNVTATNVENSNLTTSK